MADDGRGQRVYDWWSRHPELFHAFLWVAFFGRKEELRERSVAAVGADPGETVLDLACGSGVNFPLLGAQVGSDGRIVGVDYSRGMVEAARERATSSGGAPTETGVAPTEPARPGSGRTEGADVTESARPDSGRTEGADVDVLRADAARLPLSDASVDGAYSSLSLSAMADPEDAVGEVHRVLRPGARFAVFDARPFQSWPGRLLNPVIEPLSAFATNWRPEVDVVDTLRSTFETVEAESFNGGTAFVAVATRAE